MYRPVLAISWPLASEDPKPISALHEPFRIQVTTDPNLKQIYVSWYGTGLVSHFIAGAGPSVVHTTPTTPGEPLPEVTVMAKPVPSSLSLCRSLQRGA